MPTRSAHRAAAAPDRPHRHPAATGWPDGPTRAPCCPCGGELDLCQPDGREPHRLVGVCTDCGAWLYRVPTGDGRILELELPRASAAGAAMPMGPDGSRRGPGPRRPAPTIDR